MGLMGSIIAAVMSLLLVSGPAFAGIASAHPEVAPAEQGREATQAEPEVTAPGSAAQVPLRADRQPMLPFGFRPAHPSDELRRLPDTLPSSVSAKPHEGSKMFRSVILKG